ncbi:uncharacterized protein BDZ83DRAFT_613099 [Colletotrichum acutatum]|uniref:Secreted protein n=1 Tax=Glomerella acutata TaxID=27357 RepID=A0AAD8XHC3_GLOAC|nr:uncharacterized protein BDZ83DRAFT_613099 [Colletotrichum acutatum]KAK1727287.1 hypothetical protein BDZ83DRAFT_613099 [Colletotrichum acutatum]
MGEGSPIKGRTTVVLCCFVTLPGSAGSKQVLSVPSVGWFIASTLVRKRAACFLHQKGRKGGLLSGRVRRQAAGRQSTKRGMNKPSDTGL